MSGLVRSVGAKEVFKHYVLGQLLRTMPLQHEVDFSLYDFAPGPGQYELANRSALSSSESNSVVSGGSNGKKDALQQVFEYSRKLYNEKKVNPFFSYVEDVTRFNSGAPAFGKKVPPPEGYAPSLYPTSSGFASLHLGEKDRAVFIDPKQDNRDHLRRLFDGEKRVKVVDTKSIDETVQLSKALVPPTHHRGIVIWDLDALIDDMPSASQMEPTAQYNTVHSLQLDEAASILHSILKRWPTCTMFIPYPMSSHIPPISVVRTILNSGATQVLNASVFWPAKGDVPELAIGALIVNPSHSFAKSLEMNLPTFQHMFVPEKLINPKKEVARVYYVSQKPKDKVDRPTMTGESDPPSKPEHPLDFDEWVIHNPEAEEKAFLSAVGKFEPPSTFPDTPEGADDKRAWQRFVTDQIAQGQKPRGHTVVRTPRKEPTPPPVAASPPASRFRKS